MNVRRVALAAAIIGATALFAGCAPPIARMGPAVASIDFLHESTIDLAVGQLLSVTTGDMLPEDVTAHVHDPEVVEFVPGRMLDSARFHPGVTALRAGETNVTISSPDTGDITFTVSVAGP